MSQVYTYLKIVFLYNFTSFTLTHLMFILNYLQRCLSYLRCLNKTHTKSKQINKNPLWFFFLGPRLFSFNATVPPIFPILFQNIHILVVLSLYLIILFLQAVSPTAEVNVRLWLSVYDLGTKGVSTFTGPTSDLLNEELWGRDLAICIVISPPGGSHIQ